MSDEKRPDPDETSEERTAESPVEAPSSNASDAQPDASGEATPSASSSAPNGKPETEAAPEPEPAPDPLQVAQAEAARFRDQLLRTAADLDNTRKRHRRELEDLQRRAREDMLRDLLPVFDNLERAVMHAGTATDAQALGDGIRMVLKQFTDTLSRLQIARVSTVGNAFDPSTMEAIQQLETSEFPPGVVAAEVQAGYQLGERLVRPAMVVVAKAPPEPTPPAD